MPTTTELPTAGPDRRSEAARQAALGDTNAALETYADGYAEHQQLSSALERPTFEKLARWLHDGECPAAALADSEKGLADLFGEAAGWVPLAAEGAGLLAFYAGTFTDVFDLRPFHEVFLRWHAETEAETDREPGRRHPLAPLMKAWFASRPRPADTTKREAARILPAKVAMAPPGDRRAGKLFSVASHAADGPNGQLVMPGFQVDRQAPALPLALYDLGLGALEHRGRNPAAPLALRLWVASILLTRQQDRHGIHPVALEIPLRQLLADLYPGPRKPRPSEYWPLLMRASEALDSMEARVPWYDPETRKGGLWRVVDVRNIPRGPGALDDDVRIVVDLPPGSENGPQVSDNLAMWGVKSDRAYRALLNLAFWWHDPGVTVLPLGRRADGQGRFWAQSQNPAHYPEMTDDQLVQLVFPTSTKKTHRHLVRDARRVLQELQRAGEIDIIDGKPVPLLKPPPTTTEDGR